MESRIAHLEAQLCHASATLEELKTDVRWLRQHNSRIESSDVAFLGLVLVMIAVNLVIWLA